MTGQPPSLRCIQKWESGTPLGKIKDVSLSSLPNASGLVNRAVEVYERGFNLEPPSLVSDAEEIGRLVHLIQGDFGKEPTLAHAARLGVFVHNRNTPHGIRLAIEYPLCKIVSPKSDIIRATEGWQSG